MARKTRTEVGAELARSLMQDEPPRAQAAFPSPDAMIDDIARQSSIAFDFPDVEIPPLDFAKRDAVPPPPPADVDGSQVGGAPDHDQIARALEGVGIRVTLVDVAGWKLEDRESAWRWVRYGAGAPATIPQWLALFVGRKLRESGAAKAPSVAPPPATPKHADTDKHPPPMHADPPAPQRAPMFVTANKGPGITPDYQKLIETVYAVDAVRDYADLEQNLQVGEERVNYTVLMQHLDKAEDRARRAHRLYLGAKLELESWEQDSNKVLAAMRGEASEELEDEKAAGKRKKAITNPDVEARMSEKFPDEYRAQMMTRAKLKGVAEHIERLAELWKSRCHTLGAMLSNLRR